MDEIQADLEKWHHHRDRRAGLRVVRALTTQWQAIVRRMLRVADDRVEEITQEMLVLLLSSSDGSRPRAMAPPDCASAPAWRRRVLRNALISYVRKRAPWEAAEDAAIHDMPRAAARELRARRRTEGAVELRVVEPEAPDDAATVASRQELALLRQRVVSVLPQVSLRQRVAAALRLGIDPKPWAEELAQSMGEEAGAVLARMAAALERPDLAVAVLYPDEPNDESFRKAAERGVDAVKRLLGKGGA